MGSDKHYPEEAPVHRVTVDSFFIDRTPVTNRQFREFVKATGHVTFAQIPPDPKDYPGALPHMLYAARSCLCLRPRQVDLRNWGEWWTFLKGADWRHPSGPKSNINISTIIRWCTCRSRCDRLRALGWQRFADRSRMGVRCAWAGLDGAEYAWGEEFMPGAQAPGQHMAGRISQTKSERRRLRAHVAGYRVSAGTATAFTT